MKAGRGVALAETCVVFAAELHDEGQGGWRGVSQPAGLKHDGRGGAHLDAGGRRFKARDDAAHRFVRGVAVRT